LRRMSNAIRDRSGEKGRARLIEIHVIIGKMKKMKVCVSIWVVQSLSVVRACVRIVSCVK